MDRPIAGAARDGHAGYIVENAVATGVPEWLALEAARITADRLGPSQPMQGARWLRRERAYFWAVVRNRCLESTDGRLDDLRRRFLRASIEADMRRARGDSGALKSESEPDPAQMAFPIAS